MIRKFKSDKAEHEHKEFDKLLSEIFPQEVPIRFISAVKVLYKDCLLYTSPSPRDS